MCGIIAIAGREPVVGRLVEGLKRLEYRGYDSAGVAVVGASGRVERRRAPGRIAALEDALGTGPVEGVTGLAHTRWATHGAPTEGNAHPHHAGRVCIVHNGIIENFAELRADLEAQGRRFETETDSEVIAHLIDVALDDAGDPARAVADTLKRLEGAYAISVIVDGHPGLVVGARHGGPLAVGYGEGENYLASDAIALATLSNRVTYLEDGDLVIATPSSVRIFDAAGDAVDRPIQIISASAALAEKGEHRHFMQKEIHEQPEAIGRTLAHYLDPVAAAARPLEGVDFAAVDRLTIVACGTASYAGQIAKYWFESLAGLATDVDIGSEFRYRDPVLSPKGLAIAITQSGETADTKAAFELCKASGMRTGAIVNVPESSIARMADVVLPTLAGPEIGVASTKAFTAQLAALASLAIGAARARGRIDAAQEADLVRVMLETPRLIQDAITRCGEMIDGFAADIAAASDVLYLGRGPLFPLALEGALKLKEISYIHAEGYAAGELKHGPIALIDEATPVIVIAPTGPSFEKTASNVQEVAARGGPVTLMSDDAGVAALAPVIAHSIPAPSVHPMAAPIIYAAPLQLLAYHVAVHKGTDVDQPRNLAKSVTVE